MSIILSFGKYGGFYIHKGYTFRVCLGWMAITIWPDDYDNTINVLASIQLVAKDSLS